jgi:hypothetical protein
MPATSSENAGQHPPGARRAYLKSERRVFWKITL